MSAAPKPRCGMPMRDQKICWRTAGHSANHLSEEAYRRSLDARREKRAAALAAISIHGYAGYSDGCRCDVCTAAKAAYMAAKRAAATQAAQRGVAVEGVTHGTRSAYKDKGCRCEKCVEYIRGYWRDESQSRRAAA